MLTRRTTAAGLIAVILFAAQACGDELESGPGEVTSQGQEVPSNPSVEPSTQIYPPAEIIERVAETEGDWPTLHASSLQTMVQESDAVIVGRSVEVQVGYPFSGLIMSDIAARDGETAPPGHPKAAIGTPDPSGRIGPIGSWYTIQVLEVIRGTLRPGDRITVNQFGGVVDGVMHERADDPLMRVPSTYVFFLDNPRPESFGGWPFGRFEVATDGRLRTVNAEIWGWLPAVAELSGLTVNEAAARVTVAAAQIPATTAAP